MTAKTLEQEALSYALDEAKQAQKRHGLTDLATAMYMEAAELGYTFAATARDKEMRQLRLLAEDQLTTLRKLKAEMLSDTRDKEIEELRALLREACGILNDAIKTDETFWLEEMRATNEDLTERIMLMVPPIPVETK